MLRDEERSLLPTSIALNTGEDWQDAERNILLDDEWAREVAAGQRVPTIRIWRHAPVQGLVVSRRDVAGDKGVATSLAMAERNWTVFVRPTGGTAVPHGSGVLNLSLLLPRSREKSSTDAYYRLLCQPIIDWLATFGLVGSTGAMPGSYCDGNYNVLTRNKKLVGTAQAWRGGIAGAASRHPGYILAHACMMVDVDLTQATDAINRFYEGVGDAYRVDETTSTTLAQCLRDIGVAENYSAEAAQTDFSRFLQAYFQRQGVSVQMQST